MSEGVDRTIRLLSRSNNRAARVLLERALNSSHEGIRKAACTEMITNSGPRAILDFIRNIDTLDENVIAALSENAGKLAPAIRTALLGTEFVLRKNAVRAAIQFKVYDMIPVLFHLLFDRGETPIRTDAPLGELLLRLIRSFSEELDELKTPGAFHDYILKELKVPLRRSIQGFRRNDDPLPLKIYLYLYRYINDEELGSSKILRNPLHPVYAAFTSLLQSEGESYAFRFILESLEQPNVPGLVLSTLSNRMDVPFLQFLLEALPHPPSETLRANLARVHRFEWAKSVRPILPLLSDRSQKSLINLVKCSGIPEEETFAIFRQVVQFGKSTARSAALAELAAFSNEEADELVWKATEDSDPEVQAAALRQMRAGRFAKGTGRLLQFLDSPHQAVRETVRGMLPEFRIGRFLETFDQLTEDQRAFTFKIVRKIDTTVVEALTRELQVGSSAMKARALKCTELGRLVPQLEEPLCAVLLREELVPLRIKAAELLGEGKRDIGRHSLTQALHRDPALEVRMTAKASLEKREKEKRNLSSASGDPGAAAQAGD